MSDHDLTPLATRYEISAVPVDNPERRNFTVAMDRRPGGRWVVYRSPWDQQAYDRDGNESWREDSDEWRAAHWLTFNGAVALAQRIAPTITVNGYTVEDGIRFGETQLRRGYGDV